ncbi:50S ribosomal protein L11 methyltransferase [Hahella sp. SMD15-11]|uniref:Ribosomal protein L11 methyltransferase n=1 Tax=Thermohahella caldifontis TaxID=3142973 RepID=A0AB39UUK5_9GAMM
MSWLQVTVETTRDGAETVMETLEALDALSVTFADGADEPVLEPAPGETPLWQDTRVIGLWEADADRDSIRAALANCDAPVQAIHFEILEDRDWEREWMSHFEPMQFGHRLWIVPSWAEAPDPDAVNILLDPGLAFGTGTHPTTALCLEWLDSQPMTGLDVTDYGCGSGILAIAALRLGARHVTGVDIDPQALDASRDNAERNGVADRLEVFLPDQTPAHQSDIVVANILAGPLAQLAETILACLKPGGRIALSGILEEQAEDVMRAYAHRVIWDTPVTQEGWVLLSGRADS